jgi:hypothetical protein
VRPSSSAAVLGSGAEPSGAAEHPLQLLRVHAAGERPQRLHDRRVGQHPFADVKAAAGERDGALPPGVVEQLGDQAGLADAGLARHHNRGGPAARRPLQRRPELGDLGVAADKDRTGDSPASAVDHPDPIAGGVRAGGARSGAAGR